MKDNKVAKYFMIGLAFLFVFILACQAGVTVSATIPPGACQVVPTHAGPTFACIEFDVVTHGVQFVPGGSVNAW